jgi:N-acetylglucosamine kinase-like BadF-type ATPase
MDPVSNTSTASETLSHLQPKFFLGIDGGGTNCRAVLTDGDVRLLGEGRAGAANFIRVGLQTALLHIKQASMEASKQAGVDLSQIAAACIGLAGTSHPNHHRRVLTALRETLPISNITLETDARVALAGATGNKAGIVIIAGTGSIACGVDASGRFARAGGWGPAMGDEGSGSYIGRRALEAVVRAYDGRGEPTLLTDPILKRFGVSAPPELPPVIYDEPERAMREIAQLSKIVVDAARDADRVAANILRDAAQHLARAAIAVIEQLKMERGRFQVAYVGGVFEAGDLILAPLREAILKAAPAALIAPPIDPPVIGAVKMAISLDV